MEQKNSLVNELTQGKELAKQLMDHIQPFSPTHQVRLILIEKILSTYDNALSILFNLSANSSPISSERGSDEDSMHKHVLKKRKILIPSWTDRVKVCTGTRFEGALDDGYSWRKYGQKDILGANFPRGYYRCSHRHVLGCPAIKQIQKSDKDPTMYEITYKGHHTCTQSSHLSSRKIDGLKEPIKEDYLFPSIEELEFNDNHCSVIDEAACAIEGLNCFPTNNSHNYNVFDLDLDENFPFDNLEEYFS